MPFPLRLTFPLPTDDTSAASVYARQLKHLLPPGTAFDLEPDSDVTKTLQATAVELWRVDRRGVQLIEESDPRTAFETITDWERMLSLPDELVIAIPATIEERRIAVTQKYVSRGGQNYTFFETLCAACGYTLTSIDRFANLVLRAGFRVSDRVYGATYAYAMRLNLVTPTGDALSQADFERVIRHATHSHITAFFTYS